MLKRVLLLTLLPAFLFAGVGRHVKVSGGVTSGAALNIGTAWTWQWALSSSNSTLQPGDTVYAHVGRYMVDKDNGDIPSHPGNASFPIIYRAWPGDHVELYSNRTPPWAPLTIRAAYTWFWGFDVYHTDVVTINEAPLCEVQADHVKLINNIFHDAKGDAVKDYSNSYTDAVGNILYYNGRHKNPNIGPGGYAAYVQNKAPSPEKFWRENFWFSNYYLGIQFYGSDATAMDNITIRGNAFWNNGNMLDRPSEQFLYNFIIGAGEATAKVVEGIKFEYNYGWYNSSPGNGHYYYMGYNGSGISGWTVTHNVMVAQANSGFSFLEGYGSGLTFTDNMVVGPSQSVITDHPGNGNVGYANVAAASAARGVDVYIRQNPYELGRANVIIYNWDANATVSFDPSSILSSGDAYEVRSATNFWGATLASGTWTSGNITITCSDVTMATPIGSPMYQPKNPQPYFLPLVLVGPQTESAPTPQPPPVPVATAGSSIATTSFSANWQASDGATSYRLDVSTSSGFGLFVSGFNDLNVGNVTTKSVTGLSSSTTYFYRVRAVNGDGTSASSNTITVTTAALPQPPSAPVATAATNITPASLVAHWNVSATATAYFIDVSLASNFFSMISGYNNLSVGNNTSVSVTGLAEQTTYYYRVRASNANGSSGNSNTISATTAAQPPVAPNPPVAIAASNITQSSFLAQWNAASGATAYWLDVSSSPGFGTFLIGYNNLSMGSSLSRSVTGLSAVTTYYYRVRASNAGGTSGNSNTITVVTGTIPVVPPSAPATKAATSVTYSSFVANWTTRATATGYRIDASLSPTFATILAGYNNADAGADTLMPVTGLTESTNYYYRVRAFNSSGSSGNSDTATATTDAAPVGPPLPPTAVAASSITDVSFAANWLASESSTNYRLDVSPSIAFDSFVSGYNNLLTGDVTSTSVTGLSAVTTYYVRVRAVNGDGTSSSSNVITVVTGSATIVVPVTPVTTQATSIGNSFFVAHWNPVSNATSYRLDVSVADSFDTFLPGYQDLDVGNVFQRSVTGLFELRTYYYRVRAVNSAGVSDDSNTTSATTTANGLRQVWLFKNP